VPWFGVLDEEWFHKTLVLAPCIGVPSCTENVFTLKFCYFPAIDGEVATPATGHDIFTMTEDGLAEHPYTVPANAVSKQAVGEAAYVMY